MSEEDRPEISGLSPRITTDSGGTKVTIRGSCLGENANDIIGLTICGISHLNSVLWVSSRKLEVTTIRIKLNNRQDAELVPGTHLLTLTGPVLITTASGGVCQKTLQFTFNEDENDEYDDDIYDTESDVWVERTIRPLFGETEPTVKTEIVIDTNTDPLGILSAKEMRSGMKKVPDSLAEAYPNGSGDASKANFVPAMLLAERHNSTPLEYLIEGLQRLRNQIDTQDEILRGLMKENFDRYVATQDVILSTVQLSEKQNAESGGFVTNNLNGCLSDTLKESSAFVNPLLTRKKRVDRIRNVLGVIQRFKFLFQLPHSLSSMIHTGDYGPAVTDLKKAESLYGETDVQIFRQVMDQVSKIKKGLVDVLYTKLKEKDTSLKQRKRLINYLLELQGDDVDPAWECLETLTEMLLSELNSAHTKSLQTDTDVSQDNLVLVEENRNQTKVLFVRELTDVMINRFPPFWQLSQAYFHGNFYKRMPEAAVKQLQEKQNDFQSMVHTIMDRYVQLISDGFWGKDGSKLRFYLSDHGSIYNLLECVEIVCIGYSELILLRNMKVNLINGLFKLTCQFRTQCLQPILEKTFKDINSTKSWSLFTHFLDQPTLLCDEYASYIEECIVAIAKVANIGITTPETINSEKKEIITASKIIVDKFGEFILEFEKVLRFHAFEFSIDEELVRYKNNQQMYDFIAGAPTDFDQIATENENNDDKSGSTTTLNSSNAHAEHIRFQRYLRVVACCLHNKQYTIPALFRIFETRFNVSLDSKMDEYCEIFSELESEVLKNYITLKVAAFAKRTDACLLAADEGDGVREFVSNIFLQLITVYYEVDTAGASIESQIFHALVQGISDQIFYAVQAVNVSFQNRQPIFKRKSTIEAWNKQMIIDMEALKMCFGKYSITNEGGSFASAMQILNRCSPNVDKKYKKDMLKKFETKNGFKLACLQ